MTAFILDTVFFTSLLMLGALGCAFSERGGGSGLGMEGIMAFGALGGALGSEYLSGAAPLMTLGGSVLAALLAGALFSLLMAAALRFGADLKLAGAGMSLLGTAAAVFILKALKGEAFAAPRALFTLPAAGAEFNVLTVPALGMGLIGGAVLRRSRFGVCLQACGEQPRMAAEAGLRTEGIRCAGVLVSGLLGGFGGLMCLLEGGAARGAETGAAGMGFLALAVMHSGKRGPLRMTAAAAGIGALCALAKEGAIPWMREGGLPEPVLKMIPWAAALVLLALIGRRDRLSGEGEKA